MITRLFLLGGIVWLVLPVQGSPKEHRVANISMIMRHEFAVHHVAENGDVRNFTRMVDHFTENAHFPNSNERTSWMKDFRHFRIPKNLATVAMREERDFRQLQQINVQLRETLANISQTLSVASSQALSSEH